MADSSSSLTPEKRLLNLIESGGKGGAAPFMGGVGVAAAIETEALKPKLSFKEKKAQAAESTKLFFKEFQARFGLRTANKTARITLGFLALATMLNAAYEMNLSKRDPLFGLDSPGQKMAQMDVDVLSFDAGAIQSSESRNVFMPFSKREETQVTKMKTGSGAQLAEYTKNLKLTGISYNPEDPKAAYCMIEDIQKSITSFLRVGDRILGLSVIQIKEESVELEYENEKFEIH